MKVQIGSPKKKGIMLGFYWDPSMFGWGPQTPSHPTGTESLVTILHKVFFFFWCVRFFVP